MKRVLANHPLNEASKELIMSKSQLEPAFEACFLGCKDHGQWVES